ncbi:DsbA family protein [Bacillus sp. Brlt_9]|uniref:DsbA family protein n=1 Tax=Bacillus sp. Brlt_9 TaxID=3110916 RepID=UPI003F7CCB47
MRKGDIIFGVSVTTLAIAVLGGMYFYKEKAAPEGQKTASHVSETFYDVNTNKQPILGKEDAPVTLVEYGDYKCPACGFFTNSIMPEIKEKYVDTGKVKVVYKHFPFIAKDSARSAIFTEGVLDKLGNDAFWKLHEKLFASQEDPSKESEDHLTEVFLMKTAKELFTEDQVKKLDGILENKTYTTDVSNDYEEGKKEKIQSTPTVFINGKKVYNPMVVNEVSAAIDDELNKKEK